MDFSSRKSSCGVKTPYINAVKARFAGFESCEQNKNPLAPVSLDKCWTYKSSNSNSRTFSLFVAEAL